MSLHAGVKGQTQTLKGNAWHGICSVRNKMYGKAVAGKTVMLGQEREWINHSDGCLDTSSLGQLALDR